MNSANASSVAWGGCLWENENCSCQRRKFPKQRFPLVCDVNSAGSRVRPGTPVNQALLRDLTSGAKSWTLGTEVDDGRTLGEEVADVIVFVALQRSRCARDQNCKSWR